MSIPTKKQRYCQKESTRWATYEEAHVRFSQLPRNVRRRIRRRADGHFDVVVYEAVPEPQAKAEKPDDGDVFPTVRLIDYVT